MNRKGIAVAGNMIVDILYPVKGSPKPGELVHIGEGISQSVGGALCNVIGDLAVINPELPLVAIGRVGNDAEAELVLAPLGRHKNIDLSMIKKEGKTAFTAVMMDVISKERTFYAYNGANGKLCEEDFEWGKINAAILHIGYILLLDTLDQEIPVYGTKMARLLCHAKEWGIKTSIDVVSEAGDRFKRLVPPSLKYTDYCVINEIEAEQVTGILLRNKSRELISANIRTALEKMKSLGVSEWAVIHSPEGGFGLDKTGLYVESKSINLPPGWIRGKVGAGDAFCSGILYAASRGESLKEALELGNAAAAASLSRPGSTEGMLPEAELRKLRTRFK
jgi:sugar/nucleoside kinase (ribokinase family)